MGGPGWVKKDPQRIYIIKKYLMFPTSHIYIIKKYRIIYIIGAVSRGL